MKTSVEISYYPLNEEYTKPIEKFLEALRSYKEIKIITNGMSTQIFGEYDDVMKILTKEIKEAFQNPNSIFVMKIANACLDNYTLPSN
ncbi:MAG: thiamine-binding protein [Bacteroidales bacterium]|mgnify:CR=1 FL=1|jgi:uncharacterized protein YqgV (UPF0045/DUF77 family)|nr:thiamine-binding protein [Bacteroidales bacterium]MDI9575429.1 thiamine-binding protein [Bacteroidota bacterium]MDD3756184.1 thiamine-binding protein [Bacteroidales bacterium]MDY0401472.1 thiamine-binding protein [Bacteroidales bacterium]HHW58747.1 hypothetical protein [Bacteroidales bacterium]